MNSSLFPPSLLLVLVLRMSNEFGMADSFEGGGVMKVNYKFGGVERPLSSLTSHDTVRHLQILAGVDLPIGGSGRPDSVGLYYAKIGIGTPSKDYIVQVDTGSDIMWINCIQCQDCPRRGYHGLDLTLYNPSDSVTSSRISCDHEFCKDIKTGTSSSCRKNQSCLYTEIYADGTNSLGYFVEDIVHYDRVSGDLQTKSANGSVIFGCGAGQFVDEDSSDDALDGMLGFGKSNSSMISQLSSSGRIKKMFAHCLDGVNGGGIFAIGHVVQPKVNTTPLVQNQLHYRVNMTAVQVGVEFLNLTTEMFMPGDKKGALIDSGTTLAYLPELIYQPLLVQILSWQPDLKLRKLHDQYTCFDFSGSVDEGFPLVTLHFQNSLLLKEDMMCIGWQNSGMLSGDTKNDTILGDLVLSSKLVLYDLENQTIGWTEYNCSSYIKIKDELTGLVHLVGAHDLSRGCHLRVELYLFLLLLTLLQFCFR